MYETLLLYFYCSGCTTNLYQLVLIYLESNLIEFSFLHWITKDVQLG